MEERFNKRMMQFLASFIMAISFMGLASCSNEENFHFNEHQSEEYKSEVVSQLIDYNNSLESVATTRGIGWAGWLSVAISDASGAYKGAQFGGKIGSVLGPKGALVGAAVGGAIIGGSASLVQYKTAVTISNFSPYSLSVSSLTPQNNVTATYVASKELVTPDDYTLGVSAGLDSCSVKLAIQHNIILDKVETISNDGDIENLIEDLTELEKSIVNTQEFKLGYKSISEEPLVVESEDHHTSDQIMNLFIEAVKRSCISQSTLNRIIVRYTSIVDNSSELTEEEKDWLHTGFAVMAYSFSYWSEKWPYIAD